jgi:acetyl esterase
MKKLVIASLILMLSSFVSVERGQNESGTSFYSGTELLPLDPKLKSCLEGQCAIEYSTIPLDQMRAGFDKRAADREKLNEPLKSVQDRSIQDSCLAGGVNIPIRIYTPEKAGPLPVILYYHGGGWAVGNLDTHCDLCRSIAHRSGCIVVAVAYRLCPENRFPKGLNDCYNALRWVFEHACEFGGDPAKLAVAGDSAGGNLAAAVALMARDQKGPKLSYQVLIYPGTNYSFDTASYFENEEGYRLTRANMIHFWDLYLACPADGQNPYASPLRAKDLSGLPSTLIITAQYDVLRDDGEAYAARLKRAGVPVKLTRYLDMNHGFLQQAAIYPSADHALTEIGTSLSRAFR